jgi:hypothetical protein
MKFKPLDAQNNPEQGLFFFEEAGYPGKKGLKANGMAFLVSSMGFVATASHVLVDMGRIPGMEVTLYTSTSCGPISVKASILFEDHWRGPNWQGWGSAAAGLTIPKFISPEEYGEDTAILKLLAGTARAARKLLPETGLLARNFKPKLEPDAAMSLLESECRVLPLASPGFTVGARLKAWHTFWDGSDLHQFLPGEAGYRSVEPGLQHSIRLLDDLEQLGPGYSGSPFWDGERRRVVGMVRRGIKTAVPDVVLGVDARRIAAAARVVLSPDTAASSVITALRAAAEQMAPQRHFTFLQTMLPDKPLDLRLRPALPRDPFGRSDEVPGEPGIDMLRNLTARETVVLVAGGGGSGKTTLLIALAQNLLDFPLEVDGQRLMPLYIQATDFLRTGFDLESILREHLLRHTPTAPSGRALRQVLRDNDLSLLILIDGLDELIPIERAKLSGRFKRGADLAGMRAILTARPTDELLVSNGRSTMGWPVVEVAALNRQEIKTLTKSLIEAPRLAAEFEKMLAEIMWDRQGPTPLQVVAAAKLYKSETKWQRAVDLPFLLADHLLSLGIREDAEKMDRARRPRARADGVYLENVEAILEHLAQVSLDRDLDEEQIVGSLSDRTEDWAGDPEGLVRFLQTETTLLGGLIAWLPRLDTKLLCVRWLHRTVIEAFAARAVAKKVKGKPADGVKAVQEALRNNGQSSAILMLAAMDASPDAIVELSLQQTLERGSSNFKLTLFAVRALGAGIRTSPELRKRLVATLVTLLLLPNDARLGPIKCVDIFSVDDLPNPVDIANRSEIRADIIEHLRERFGRRAAVSRRKGDENALIRITVREAQMLDRLGMWSEIKLPYVQQCQIDAGQVTSPHAQRGNLTGSERNGPIVAAGLLSFAVGQLQEDADGFLAGFASFVHRLGPEADLNEVGRLYVSQLLKR